MSILALIFIMSISPVIGAACIEVISINRIVTQEEQYTTTEYPTEVISEEVIGYRDLLPERKYTDKLDFTVGFEVFFDIEEAKAYAKEVNKPIFLYFTGKTCANCREMEQYVFADSKVREILNNDYVMGVLYCDINTIELSEKEWITSKDGKVIKTLGKKNLNYQKERFNANAQPLYVLMDSDENILTEKNKHYDKKVDNFISFLEEGKTNFKKQKKN